MRLWNARSLLAAALDIGQHRTRQWVVLVKDGTVIGEGFTQPAGERPRRGDGIDCGSRGQRYECLQGATAYVTLEPCSHQGQTGPCVAGLIEAGLDRVVVAVEDPNPQVAGQGLSRLREAGIEVDVGTCAEEVEQDLAGFLLRMRRGYGRITLKIAASLDGRTAMASGESQWISSEPRVRMCNAFALSLI